MHHHKKQNTMKKFNVLFLFTALSIAASAQPQNAKLALKLVPRSSFVNNRDGQNIQVSIDAFYMSNEVTNKEYRAFVNDLKQHPNDTLFVIEWRLLQSGSNKPAISKYTYSELREGAIDTTVCDKANYFTNSQYDDFPVVGVTRQNAMFYCAWLTQKENQKKKEAGKPYATDYRLPTEFEWIAANNGVNKGIPEAQLSKSVSGTANELGLYNLCGNVREWTFTKTPTGKSVVMGNSWNAPDETNSRSELPDSHCDCYTGFRIVTSVLSELKK
jgi:formylglycine-generating enzyme required for sulfatase activity